MTATAIIATIGNASTLPGSVFAHLALICNWSTNADLHNAENLLVIRDPTLAAAYEANFESRLSVSEMLDADEAAHQK